MHSSTNAIPILASSRVAPKIMNDWLSERAAISPHKPAVVVGQQVWTYQELDHLANRYASQLMTCGIGFGEMLGVLMTNSLAYIALIHASFKIGAVLVPLNPRLTSSEVAWQISYAGCQLLICDEDLDSPDYHGLCQTFTLPKFEHIKPIASVPNRPMSLDELACVVFTSGTTGIPKGVLLAKSNIFYSAMASAYRLGTLPNDQWLCVLPLYHVGGQAIVIRACLYGITINLHTAFDLETVNYSLGQNPISLISLVPTMLYRLLTQTKVELWSKALRVILLGGAAANPELMAMVIEKQLPVATTYGLSEAASQVCTMLAPATFTKPSSVGKPLLFSSIKIGDEHGNLLPEGAIGEIAVSGPTVMQGYLNNPSATSKAIQNGFLYTGDMGYLDDDGDLWVIQRRSDLILSGGENVYPTEVEDALRQHPAIREACVVGIQDAEWGMLVSAAVILEPEMHATSDEIQQFCRGYLAGYKIPRRIEFVQHLPETASGKIQRTSVIELFR